MATTKTLLIVHHSPTASTQRMTNAVRKGATTVEIEGVDVRALDALRAGPDDLLAADGLILGTPENFGYMSGALKHFLDRSYNPALDQINGMPYALYVRAGNDGSGAISSVRRIVSGLGLREVQEPVLIAGEFDENLLIACEELGMALAAGLECGVF